MEMDIGTLLHVLDPPLLLLEGTQESALTNVNGRTSHVAQKFADQTCHVFNPPSPHTQRPPKSTKCLFRSIVPFLCVLLTS